MASMTNYYEDVVRATKEGRLMPAREIVQNIMLQKLPTQGKIDLLMDQVRLAKKLRCQQTWLQIVSREADTLQFQGASWIDKNIQKVHRQAKTASLMPAGPSKDIRLGKSSLEAMTETLARTGLEEADDALSMTSEAERALLEEDAPEGKPQQEVKTPPREGSPANRQRPSPVELRRSPRKKDGVRSEGGPWKTVTSRSSTRGPQAGETRKASYESNRRKPTRRSPREEFLTSRNRRGSPQRRDRRGDYSTSHQSAQHRQRHQSPRRTTMKRQRSTSRDATHKRPKPAVTRDARGQPLCCVMGCTSVLDRAHALQSHIAGIFNEDQHLTEKVNTLRLTALNLCARWVNHTPDLEALVKFINLAEDMGSVPVTPRQQDSAEKLLDCLDIKYPKQFTLGPLTSVGLLGHWRAMVVVVSLIGAQRAQELKDNFPAVETMEYPQPWDSHFHLDRLFSRWGGSRTDLKIVLGIEKLEDEEPVEVSGGAAVFCDPPTYPTQDEVDCLASQGVVTAIGLHPLGVRAIDKHTWEAFDKCLAFPGVRALGEVGLDYSAPLHQWSTQHIILDEVCKRVTLDKVLVLHNRGPKNGPAGEMLQLLYQLKGVVSREQRMHVHCFQGTKGTMDLWLKEFPNVHFGFTPLIGKCAASHEGVRSLNQDRLLLETDAPYFQERKKNRCSTPAFLGIVARIIASIRGESWTDVLKYAGDNAKRLYNVDQ